MSLTLPAFVARWLNSGAEERANKDLFFTELCDVLEIPRPNPKTGDPARDTYVFEKDVRIPHEGATTSIGKVDLYKEGHVLVEAKQGKGELSKKIGSAKRDTPAWNIAMDDARGQALGYARTLTFTARDMDFTAFRWSTHGRRAHETEPGRFQGNTALRQ